MQNTASGAHVARLNFHGITSYDLINLLEHIIQSAQHLTPHLYTAAAGWAVIGRGEGTVGNTTYHVAGSMTLTACCQSLSVFFHSADDGPAQLQPYGRRCLVNSSPDCRFGGALRSSSCSSWNWQLPSPLSQLPVLDCRWEMTEGQNKLSEASTQINQSWRILTAFVGGLTLVKHRSWKEKMHGGFTSSATMRGITQAQSLRCNNVPFPHKWSDNQFEWSHLSWRKHWNVGNCCPVWQKPWLLSVALNKLHLMLRQSQQYTVEPVSLY